MHLIRYNEKVTAVWTNHHTEVTVQDRPNPVKVPAQKIPMTPKPKNTTKYNIYIYIYIYILSMLHTTLYIKMYQLEQGFSTFCKLGPPQSWFIAVGAPVPPPPTHHFA